jgi:hypothetical protein
MAAEKEQLVADDWSAERAAVLILNVFRHFSASKKDIPGFKRTIGVVVETDAVELICSGFDGYVDRGAASKPLLRVHAVRYHIHAFNRFQRRHVSRVLRQPDVGVPCSVDPGVIGALSCTVYVRDETFLRRGNNRILSARRREPGDEFQQFLIISRSGNGKVLKLTGRYVASHIRPIRLQCGCRSGDNNRLRSGRDFQLNVSTTDGVH